MKRVRRVTEAEVIAEFLKSEYYEAEFQADRDKFQRLVLAPDTTNDAENAVRRALLFRRRGHMWRELPADTQWWQVELAAGDLAKVRVFPRAQWRRVSNGSFYIQDIVERMRSRESRGKDKPFLAKVHAINAWLRERPDPSTVVLIGVDEAQPLTILEGNHRLTAALLTSPELARTRFRVVCGFSPRMHECCWYETNLATLWRYAKNRFRNLVDKEADVNRVLAATDAAGKGPALAASKGFSETE